MNDGNGNTVVMFRVAVIAPPPPPPLNLAATGNQTTLYWLG